ncbi:TlpA family protein disulfide reductase [Candidatus Nitrospira salsa]
MGIWIREIVLRLMVALGSLVFLTSAVDAAPPVKAPEFELVMLDGQRYSKDSLRGQPTLLVFWAPWCHFCQLELPLLAKFYRENKPDQLRILTIAFADTRANVEDYVKDNPETFVFPTAYDQEDQIAQKFGVSATPTFVVMNEHGDLTLAHFGARLNQNPQYQAFLESLR